MHCRQLKVSLGWQQRNALSPVLSIPTLAAAEPIQAIDLPLRPYEPKLGRFPCHALDATTMSGVPSDGMHYLDKLQSKHSIAVRQPTRPVHEALRTVARPCMMTLHLGTGP